MKWSVVILVVCGIVAAVAAAMLVGALQANRVAVPSSASASKESVLVAKDVIPAMTIINAQMIERKDVPRDGTSEALTDETQAIGRVLPMRMEKGQPLTKNLFSPPGTGADLAAHLPKGMRAVAVDVQDAAALPGILYPGCNVDVLVAIKRQMNPDETPRTISTTLLENVPVLAVDQQTIVTPRGDKKQEGVEPAPTARSMKVTLQVDPQQAKMLQLAGQSGSITLSMRNPQDSERAAGGPVTLKFLGGAGSEIAAQPVLVPASEPPPSAAKPVIAAPTTPDRPRQWEVQVLRGPTSETTQFPMPKP